MKKHFTFGIHPLLVALIAVAVVYGVAFGAYGATRWASAGEVMGRVEVAGVQLGGLDRELAIAEVVGLETDLLQREARFALNGETVTLDPAEVAFDIDEEGIVDEAMRIGREGNAVAQFLWWLNHIFSSETVGLRGSIDPDALDEVLDHWDTAVIASPAEHGGILIVDGEPAPVYPEPGVGVDRQAAAAIILDSFLAGSTHNAALPTEPVVPGLTADDIDLALDEARRLLGQPIRMTYDGLEAVFTTEQLTAAFRSETVLDGQPRIVQFFDPEVIDGYLAPIRSQFEAEPVNAEFAIVGDTITIVPGLKGTRIDEEETALRLYQAGLTSSRIGRLPLVEDADPEITTEYLEGLGIDHLVSSFTTYHACCQPRVKNIQLMADTIDMTILMPGETFGINEFVGQRTAEKGYVPAGTIVRGQLEDTVGGGVSQFATTFYNAVFWGGYEDVEHRPHSYYFRRYPEGIEATVNWRVPELKFRNNTERAILLDTQYTDTSITVRIFGYNDGRTVKGEQIHGNTHIEVVSEGGPNALWVEGSVSGRFAPKDPPPPRYVANPELGVDEQVEVQGERGGWSVRVTRRILRGGVELVEEQEWLVTYFPQFAVIEVHPCKMPDAEEECPPTSTTTTLN
jgi:vancomycin resistance protein YoaR